MQVTRHKSRFEISGVGFDPSNIAFVRSLPDAKLAPSQNVWRVPATCCIAAELQKFGATLSTDVKEMAEAWNAPDVDSDAPPPEQLTPAWRHQAAAFWFGSNKPAVMLGMEMGCGKTKVTIDLLNHWDCRRVLILCPKVVVGVWPKQFATHSRPAWQVTTLDPRPRTTKLSGMERRVEQASNALIRAGSNRAALVCNYEAAASKQYRELRDWLLSQQWDAVICDESHRIKTHDSVQSKFCYELGRKAKRRLALTGTPLANSPLDVYGQYRFLDCGVFGSSWVRFKARYSRGNPMFPGKVDAYVNQEELTAKMGRIMYRVKTRDVIDLPPEVHQDVPVVLESKTRAIYDELSEELIAEVEGNKITVANALVKLLRLQQITGGWVQFDEEETARELGGEKQEALTQLLSDIEPHEPAVIFTKYSTDLQSAKRAVEAAGRRAYFICGGKNQLREWLAGPPGGGMIAQIQAGGLGINEMVVSRYCIYYSLGFSLADYEQSLFRISRPGQTRSTMFYHLVAQGSVDEKVYRALQDKKDVVSYVLDNLRGFSSPAPARLAS